MHKYNIIYIVPDLSEGFGAPSTRTRLFKEIFFKNGGDAIEKGNKLKRSFVLKRVNLTYIESATNRVSFVDIISLIFLRIRSKEVIVFIRDIYIELFPEDYKSLRSYITLILNKLSNLLLITISNKVAFPTKDMGDIFYSANKLYPKRKYLALPPGTRHIEHDRLLPDFNNKIGLLYLGSVSYKNSGFESFINFADANRQKYNFFVLSRDQNAVTKLKGHEYIHLTKVDIDKIGSFIKVNNIAFGFHTRPRNFYDDVTFPIKVLDFISLQLPFFTEEHKPIVDLLGKDYKLFVDIDSTAEIEKIISKYSLDSEYELQLDYLKSIANANTYAERYDRLFAD